MPRELKKHEEIVEAFRSVESISELVEQLPNGEFRNELDMDIILFGRAYRDNKVGPYVRLLEFLPGEVIIQERTWESNIFYILVNGRLEASVTERDGETEVIGEIPKGHSFGEMALLSGTPRTATVRVPVSAVSATVLEFTRPALRLLRKLPKFGQAVNRDYRSYGLSLTLNDLSDSTETRIPDEMLRRLNDASRFAVYEKDHVLFREGDPVNRVVYVRNGWIQRVSAAGLDHEIAGRRVDVERSAGVDFLGAGSCLGIEAVDKPGNWKYTATVRGRAEVVEIAITRLREDTELKAAIQPVLQRSSAVDYERVREGASSRRAAAAAGKEIETGIVDGVNLLVMDMAKCIRCGNCSLACHKVHGHSRLVRRGIHIERPVKPDSTKTQSVLAPSVCMHCQDPKCLTGCPTGAIARFPDGEIDIEPAACIGCGDCATQCPYNAISLIPRDAEPHDAKTPTGFAKIRDFFSLRRTELPPAVTQTENLLAVKCNLCRDTPMNPAGATRPAYSCEENCPTGALVRVNPHEYFGEINSTIGIIQKSKTHAIGVNIHKFDPMAAIWHIAGTIAVVVVGGLAVWATIRFTQDTALTSGSWVTMRWITGLTGLAAILWVMAYPVRKQIYRRRAGALRYWMLSHIYLGVLAGILLLAHGGSSSGGILTSMLMITFDLVIASGVFGAVCYIVIPRFMTKIEREPLLLEDLQARREELRAQLVRVSEQTKSENLKQVIRGRVRRRFLGPGYLLRQYLRREDLNSMLADARAEFRGEAEGMSRIEEARLMEAVENAATLRRIDALCYLHNLLRAWVAPHVLFTSIMLVLMAIHIIQVVYFNVR